MSVGYPSLKFVQAALLATQLMPGVQLPVREASPVSLASKQKITHPDHTPIQSLETEKSIDQGDRGDHVLKLHQALQRLGYTVRAQGIPEDLRAPDNEYDVFSALAVARFQKDHMDGSQVEGEAGTQTLEAINKATTYFNIFDQQLRGRKPGLKKGDLVRQFELLIRETAIDYGMVGENDQGENRGLVEWKIMPRYAEGKAWCAAAADFLRQQAAVKLGLNKRNLLSPHLAREDNISVEKLRDNAHSLGAFHGWSEKSEPNVGDILLLSDAGHLFHATTIINIGRDSQGEKIFECMGGNISLSKEARAILDINHDVILREDYSNDSEIIAGFVDNRALMLKAFEREFPGRISDLRSSKAAVVPRKMSVPR